MPAASTTSERHDRQPGDEHRSARALALPDRTAGRGRPLPRRRAPRRPGSSPSARPTPSPSAWSVSGPAPSAASARSIRPRREEEDRLDESRWQPPGARAGGRPRAARRRARRSARPARSRRSGCVSGRSDGAQRRRRPTRRRCRARPRARRARSRGASRRARARAGRPCARAARRRGTGARTSDAAAPAWRPAMRRPEAVRGDRGHDGGDHRREAQPELGVVPRRRPGGGARGSPPVPGRPRQRGSTTSRERALRGGDRRRLVRVERAMTERDETEHGASAGPEVRQHAVEDGDERVRHGDRLARRRRGVGRSAHPHRG